VSTESLSPVGPCADSFDMVIFDMDGVIFDTERLAITAWKEAGAHFGYNLSEEIVLETVGLCTSDTGSVFCRHFGDDFPYTEVLAAREYISRRHFQNKGVPVKYGAVGILDTLEKIGKKSGLATSTRRQQVVDNLARAGFSDRFAPIVCGDDVAARKPAPDVYRSVGAHLVL
jgi:beta-phosphoglucomutase-like phosphatase (HAD superfamily)